MRILFLSAEVRPFSKVGGLGDVAGSLPAALHALGHDVRVFTPAHRAVEDLLRQGKGPAYRPPIRVALARGELEAGALEGRLPGTDVPVYFLARRELFDRERIYGYDDDPWRFSFFCRAVFVALADWGWLPQVVHANDWHTAAAVAWLRWAGDRDLGGTPTVFTIHNLAHQGHADRGLLATLGVPAPPLPEEAPGRLNLMARAIHDAHTVSTVSPTYAEEILTPDGGAGLEGLLRRRPEPPTGIVNGLDYREWDPAGDAHLAARYDATNLERRVENRRELESILGLTHSRAPLVVMVSRLDRQKGAEILPHLVRGIATHASGARFAILGSGEREHSAALRELAAAHPGRVVGHLDRFDNELAHRMYGGGDLLLMPSLFEPCGLTQLIGMRYGCPPVVRATGGLRDTVAEGRTGFRFERFDAGEAWGAVTRALDCLQGEPDRWRAIQRAGMEADWSWTRSARAYVEMYARTIELSRSGR